MFDTHAHYDDKRFRDDRDSLLKNLQSHGVTHVLNSGASYTSSKEAIKLAQKYDYIYAAVGVHPHYADSLNDEKLEELKSMCNSNKVVAYGEIGLDFYYDNSPREVQEYWFKRQLETAKEVKLPVIIHSRDADAKVFDILKEADMPDYGGGKGVIHCYSGSKEVSLEYAKMGYLIGVGGVITFDNAKKLVQAVESLPIEAILLETDCPYLSPVPNRGERNDSKNLTYVVKKIVEVKNMTEEEVIDITTNNAKKLFNVS